MPNAGFAAQAEPLADVHTLEGYTEWMKGLLVIIPDGSYVVKSFATDHERGNVCAYGVFSGTHSGPGGPVPPTGKRVSADYVYAMEFDGRQDQPHDQDLECRLVDEGTRLGRVAHRRSRSHIPLRFRSLRGCVRDDAAARHDGRGPRRAGVRW